MLNYSLVINYKELKKSSLPIKQFDQIVKIVSKEFKIKKQLYFDVSIVNKSKIKDINNKYRHINKVTDVITFALNDAKGTILTNLLGEIYICLDQARLQAKNNHWSIKNELCLLFIHGILHLFQIDHQTKKDYDRVIKIQNSILNKVKF